MHISGMELNYGEKTLLYVSFKPIFYLVFCLLLLEGLSHALAGVAQWIERWPANQRGAGSVSSPAHAWVAGQVPSGGCTRGHHTLMFLFLSFSLPSPL